MIRRILLAVLGGALLVVTLPGIASATVSDGNSLGSYTCNAWGLGDSNASWSCDIRDAKCDGVAVYTEYRYISTNVMSGWQRASGNSGGCGTVRHYERSAFWAATIEDVDFRLCKVVNNAWDTCYDSTEQREYS